MKQQMGYRGRVISALFVAILLLFIREMVSIHFGHPPHPYPIPAIIVLILAWLLGKQYDKYVYLSTRDPLTGLYNRRYVHDKFRSLAKYADRKNVNISILLLDVNDFKEINDQYGHQEGDSVLGTLSTLLRHSFGPKDILARWGGDEFIILSVFSDVNVLSNKINDFKSRLDAEDWEYKGNVSISIGQAVYPVDAANLQKLLDLADNNMYEEKVHFKKKRGIQKSNI